MNLIKEKSGQVSAELILLFAGIIVVVLIALNIYQNYIISMDDDIKYNELNNLTNKIDKLNVYIKEE